MEYTPKSRAQRFENGAVTAWEYGMHNANLNVARISIKGRYPEDGFTGNLRADAIVHILNGTGVLTINNDRVVELSRDDQVHIEIGDMYYFEGNLEIIYAASPEWTPEQTKHIN